MTRGLGDAPDFPAGVLRSPLPWTRRLTIFPPQVQAAANEFRVETSHGQEHAKANQVKRILRFAFPFAALGLAYSSHALCSRWRFSI
jgi:hypothetical protein